MTGGPTSPPRVLLGPVNIAGFLWEYAEGLRELGAEATVVTVGASPQQFPSDVVLKPGKTPMQTALRLGLWLAGAARRFDVFHFDYGMTILPRHVDLPLLRALGKRVVIQFMGSEARCGRYARDGNNADESLHCMSCRAGRCMGAEREDNIRRLARWGNVFLGYPDMSYEHLLPESRRFTDSYYLQAIDLRGWQAVPPPTATRVPRIVHAPSNPLVKGTTHVLAAIEAMRADGVLFEFDMLQGVPQVAVKAAMANADIVVDQLLSATNGRLAIEAMALGKPVLCSLSDVYAAAHPELPIVRTNPESIKADLRRLLDDPNLRQEIGLRGRQFVEKICDRKRVAARLLRLYTAPMVEVQSHRDWWNV